MRVIAAILVVLLAAGCVPKGRYDEALADIDTLNGEIERLARENAELDHKVFRLRSELKASEAALVETNRKLAAKIAEAGELQQDVEETRAALQDAEKRKARADEALRTYRDLVARFQALIDAGTLEVKVIDGQMVVELATDILFPPGSASLSAEGRDALEEVAAVLASIPDREYQVAGHTDSVPISTERFPTNWHLGAERAISVVRLLMRSGLSADRVSAASWAEFDPVDTNRTPEGRANNRRIEIIVVPDLSGLPGYDELEAVTEGAVDASSPEDTVEPAP